jgi:hypothetical protein
VTVEPRYDVIVERLISRRIGDERAPDPAKSPHRKRCEGKTHSDGDNDGEREREKLRQARLQPLLQRPDHGDDEECEHERRKDTCAQISADCDRGHDDNRGRDPLLDNGGHWQTF